MLPNKFRFCNAAVAGSKPGRCRGQRKEREDKSMMNNIIKNETAQEKKRIFNAYKKRLSKDEEQI